MPRVPSRRPRTARSKNVTLDEAVILAAKKVGEDNQGRHGLVGYLARMARTEPKLFAEFLARVAPDKIFPKRNTIIKSKEEARQVLLEAGLLIEPLFDDGLPEPHPIKDDPPR